MTEGLPPRPPPDRKRALVLTATVLVGVAIAITGAVVFGTQERPPSVAEHAAVAPASVESSTPPVGAGAASRGANITTAESKSAHPGAAAKVQGDAVGGISNATDRHIGSTSVVCFEYAA